MPLRRPRSFSTTEQMWEMVTDTAKRTGRSQSAIINEALERYLLTAKIDRGDWDTVSEDGSYDPRLFYTASQDSKGHSAKLVVQAPKNLAGLISRVIATGAIPEYRSLQDFLRDAFTHRAHQVARWVDDGELAREATITTLLAEEEQIAQTHADMVVLLDSIKGNLERALHRRQFVWIINHVKERLGRVTSINESYQEQYMEMLNEYAKKAKTAVREGKGHLMVVRGEEEAVVVDSPKRRRGRPPKTPSAEPTSD